MQSDPDFSVALIWLPDLCCVWDSDSASLVQTLGFGGAPAFLPAGHLIQATKPSSAEPGVGPALGPELSCPSWDGSHTLRSCLLGSRGQPVATEQSKSD